MKLACMPCHMNGTKDKIWRMATASSLREIRNKHLREHLNRAALVPLRGGTDQFPTGTGTWFLHNGVGIWLGGTDYCSPEAANSRSKASAPLASLRFAYALISAAQATQSACPFHHFMPNAIPCFGKLRGRLLQVYCCYSLLQVTLLPCAM